MSTTLESIKAAHAELGGRIAALEAQAVTEFLLPETEIQLHAGEHYAGIILNADGTPSHHLILLPGDAEDLTWKAATAWAQSEGGDLPTRPEQALLYANLKDHFQPRAYWSAAQHADPRCAWCQFFYGGNQRYFSVSAELRARAVRRLIID